jgi:hypothetical protein
MVLATIPILAATAVLAAGAAPGDGQADRMLAMLRSGDARLRLELRFGDDPDRSAFAGALRGATEPTARPVCVADVCPARVEVPGLAQPVRKVHKTELFASMLDRAGIEPFATVAAVIARTGLRVGWSPPDPTNGDPAGWGSFMVRLRLRIDALGRPALFERDRKRNAQRSWKSFIAPGA